MRLPRSSMSRRHLWSRQAHLALTSSTARSNKGYRCLFDQVSKCIQTTGSDFALGTGGLILFFARARRVFAPLPCGIQVPTCIW